ncbi:TPA: TrbG/VirB9 family P-type conjugative transfer protein [Stenotrophomonas maltophilia]|nr:TrbG/VirB9 family P-type conjugative transfer protein [Stenotrophomonas maltophilia]
MLHRQTIALALLFCSAAAAAAPAPSLDKYQRESKSRFDPRVKIVEYNPLAIVTLKQALGYSTHIQLAADEEVIDVAAGDTLAWEVAPSGNHVFLKPKEVDGRTNVAIVTTKRPYQFVVDVLPKEKLPDNEMTLFLVFMYPEDPLVKVTEQQGKDDTQSIRAALKDSVQVKNTRYEACRRNRQINPISVWDDGRFTYMKFRAGQSLPTVQALLPDGQEGMLNFRMGGQEGDGIADSRTMILFETAKRFTVRYGKTESCIINRGEVAAPEDLPSDDSGSTKSGFLRVFRSK